MLKKLTAWFTRLDPEAKKVTVSEVEVTGKKVA